MNSARPRNRVVTGVIPLLVAATVGACSGPVDRADPIPSPSSTPFQTATISGALHAPEKWTSAATSSTPRALPGAPEEFVAVRGDGLAQFDAVSGKLLHRLTSPPQRFLDGYPVLTGNRVVFVRQSRRDSCDSSIRWVAGSGQRSGSLVAGGQGPINEMTVSADGNTLAYSYEPCGSDLPAQVKVLDVASGQVTLAISNKAGFNGSPSPIRLMLVRGRLVVFVGFHLTTWLAGVDLANPEATELSDLPRLPFSDRCSLDNAVAQADSAIVGLTTCGRGMRVYHLTGRDLQNFHLGPIIANTINGAYLTGATDDGYLIGVTGLGGRDIHSILQIHGGRERVLPMCANPERRGKWCKSSPVWRQSTQPSEEEGQSAHVSYAHSAKQSRAKSVRAFLDSGGRRCGSEDLRRRFGVGGGAGGWIIGGISIVNTSHSRCALLGPMRFVGLDAWGRRVTKVSTCDEMILKHQSCAAPIVLYPRRIDQPHRHHNAISVRLYGWGRGGVRDRGCPQHRVVAPAVLSLSLGELTLRIRNHDPHWEPAPPFPAHMWGCGGIGIATGSGN